MARYGIEIEGIPQLENELNRLNSVRWNAVVMKQVREMLNRARQPGGTPVDSGELRDSSRGEPNQGLMGYTAEYAPHVEYGHRTVDGGYVAGQHFLKENVDTQRDIYKEDLLNAIRSER